MWFRFLLLAQFLAALHLPAGAQLLGNLNEYPNLHISIHYRTPDGSGVEGMQLYWSVNEKGVLKVTGTAQPKKKPSIDTEMPATAIAPIFADARAVTKLFRFKSNKENKVGNEMLTLHVSNCGLRNQIHLTIRRSDKDAWAAAVKLWKDLRTILPSPGREMLNESF